ncbi:amidase family protein, partial [Rhodococcus sp. IEGM 69]
MSAGQLGDRRQRDNDGDRSPGLVEQAQALASGATTSVAATRAALDRIDASQPTLNAFKVIRRNKALAEAAEADRRIAAGERLPLLGVPIA